MFSAITTDLDRCRQLLKSGEVVAIPTETVYGLAANCMDDTAVEKIFKTKGRPTFNPLIVHIHSVEQLQVLTKNVPEKAKLLAKKFWPGPLTLILPKNEKVSDLVTAGKPTVGIRMPNHKLTLELLAGLDFPVAAPSANPFTRVSPTSAQNVNQYFGDAVTVLDGGPCIIGLESTIIGFEDDLPVIYRKGGVAIEEIEACVGNVKLYIREENTPVAPGMLGKHYSPKTPLLLSQNIEKSLSEFKNKKIGILSYYRDDYSGSLVTKVLSQSKNLKEAAHNLYQYLHQLDAMNLDIIIAEELPEVGLGRSINDRLQRAQNS